jgi:hypothetical protein
MIKVFNQTDVLVSLVIERGEVKDGIHVQPFGRVTLPEGWSVNTNSSNANPRVIITDTDRVSNTVASVTDASLTSADTSMQKPAVKSK